MPELQPIGLVFQSRLDSSEVFEDQVLLDSSDVLALQFRVDSFEILLGVQFRVDSSASSGVQSPLAVKMEDPNLAEDDP